MVLRFDRDKFKNHQMQFSVCNWKDLKICDIL